MFHRSLFRMVVPLLLCLAIGGAAQAQVVKYRCTFSYGVGTAQVFIPLYNGTHPDDAAAAQQAGTALGACFAANRIILPNSSSTCTETTVLATGDVPVPAPLEFPTNVHHVGVETQELGPPINGASRPRVFCPTYDGFSSNEAAAAAVATFAIKTQLERLPIGSPARPPAPINFWWVESIGPSAAQPTAKR